MDVVTGGAESQNRLAWGKSIVAAVLVGILIVSAFVGVITLGSRPAAAAAPFRSLRIGTTAWTVTTYNPMAITLVDEYIIVYTVYSTLLTHDKSYQIQGDLAYSWSLASDNVTWTFNLVHGAYFADPTNPSSRAHEVTSADVVFSYELQMNETASILNTYTSDIQSVSAVDRYTVQIVTKRPVATMYSTTVNIPILPEYVWSSIHNAVKYNPPYPIGSGGYYFDNVNSTTTLAILRKNPNYYWDAYYCMAMKPDEIRYVSYTNPTQMVGDFTTGANQLNAVIGIDPTTYTTTLKDWTPKWAVDQGFVGEFSINAMTDAQRAGLIAGGTTQFRTGSNNQILATNQLVRRAVAMSIDKQGLITDALLGLGKLGDSLIPDTNPWHYSPPPQYTYQFNTSQARALLNSAGWKYDSSGALNANATPLYQAGGTNGLIFRFYTLNTEDWWKLAAQDIVGWLNKAGIETTDIHGNAGYGAYSINQMSGYWLSGDYDMWLWDWVFTPASDPSTDILEVETSQAIGPTSDNFYSNATFDALYNQSVTTLDPAARRAILNEMQMMVYNYSSYIIPFYKDDLYAALVGSPGGGQSWQNWGDWGVQNALTPDSDLMNLWAQVDPTDNPSPVIVSFPPVVWFNGSAAEVSVNVNDPQATSMTYSFDFGDGTPVVDTTTLPATHTYATTGNYTIKVRVRNSEFPACGSTTATIVPAGSVNLPPQIQSFGPSKVSAYPNDTLWFNLTAKDHEGDPLYITWKFGDGATATSYVTTGTQTGISLSKTHVYTAIGTYTASIVVTDNETGLNLNHSPETNATVQIVNPPSKPITTVPQGNWLINYGIPILIVAVIVIAVTVVMLQRRKRAKKEEAETTEEPKQSPPSGPPPP